ncbi:MAG: tRNA (adenosine(37)-N6)-threonylcarbamoyltransferase complex transferase subunit TsaD [Patescibacteria group bacterium]|nr:tRNA (adenosine(37)-N6)-threonylcarbamoyltransferase complex transferase subunit TsaD [Patescibacteria group bacterium]
MQNPKLIKRILAIETSCDETAAAVIKIKELRTENLDSKASVLSSQFSILSNIVASQINIHKKFGGVFPEHASRAHSEKIIPVVEEALTKVQSTKYKEKNKDNIDLVAVTTGPGLIGSLLIGVNFAKTYAYAKNLPIIGINHWLGHIYSCFTEKELRTENLELRRKNSQSSDLSPQISNLPSFPSLILIVSGGHTGLVLMKSHTNIQPLGETLDDAAGEAFDKVAKLLGLEYPGGPAISKVAQKGDPNIYKFPRSMLDRKDYNFSFSGLKTAVLYKVQELTKRYPLNAIRSQIAYEFQQAVIDILVGKTIQAAYEFKPKSICLCGGVSANKELRQQLKMAVEKLPSKTSYHVPSMELTTDNAAMIGIAAAYQDKSKYTTWDKINADANLKLD